MDHQAEEEDTHSVIIVASDFSGNALDGILMVEFEAQVMFVSLTAVRTNDNVESGLDIIISGQLVTHAVQSEGNGEPDTIITG